MKPEPSGDKLKPTSSPERIGHFSMIRGFQLADFFTLGNAACGVAAVFLAMLYIESRVGRSFFQLGGDDGRRFHI